MSIRAWPGLEQEARERFLDEIERGFLDRGQLEPLRLGGADERTWLDCELASYAENRLGDPTSPDVLTPEHRARWCARAITEPLWSPDHRTRYEHLYWLRAGDQRVGTLALSAGVGHGSSIRASSLYVFPAHRRQGIAGTVLRELRDGLCGHGLALRLETCWTWQPALRTYMRMGAWVHMWKRDISLRFDGSVPPPIVDFDGDHASMTVDLDGARAVLERAHQQGERLVLEDLPPSEDPRVEALRWDSRSTFALALALQGWPLVRSQEEWDHGYYADAGPPEALAYRIIQWEAWSRSRGWNVDTPRIPGLRYPTWDELETRWARENAEFERRAAKAP